MQTADHPKTPERRRASTGRLHSPTRETVLRLIEAESAPVSIAAVAEATGWHVNTVRGHVTALWEDGYLSRSREQRDAQGRPSWLWSAKRPEAASPYAELAGVLAESLARMSRDPSHDAREAGRSWGLSVGAGLDPAVSPADAVRTVVDVMRDQGFAPSAAHAGDALVLRQCPLIEAASRHSDIVCQVHLGMVVGLLEAVGAADCGSRLLPFTAPGQCTLHLRVAE